MLYFIYLKTFFFTLDFLTFITYLVVIWRYKFIKYFFLTLIFGTSCMLTSVLNIILIFSFREDDLRFNWLYLLFRTYIYIIEWAQYILFLEILKKNNFKWLVLAILTSSCIIHIHYWLIESYEESILNLQQYISPIDFIISAALGAKKN